MSEVPTQRDINIMGSSECVNMTATLAFLAIVRSVPWSYGFFLNGIEFFSVSRKI